MHHPSRRDPTTPAAQPQNWDYEPFIVWQLNSARSALCYVCQRPTTTRASLAATPTILWAICMSHPNKQAVDMIRRHQETP